MDVLHQYEHTSSAQLLNVSNEIAGAVSNPRPSVIGQVTTRQQVVVSNSPMYTVLSPATVQQQYLCVTSKHCYNYIRTFFKVAIGVEIS